MIFIYKYLGIILIPFIKLNLFFRIKNNKEIKNRYKERFGITSKKKLKKNLIWIHAASLGEFKSTDIIINKFCNSHTILITTTTVSAANYALNNYGTKIIHQFAPLDIYFWVDRFLNHWKPNLVIWVESDLWPLTMKLIKKKKIKAIFINARMSPRSFQKWKEFKFFYNQIVDTFSVIFAQSLNDKKRISYLTNKNIKFIGNLKLSSIKKNNVKKTRIKIIKNNLTLMLASTHKNEEYIFISIIKKLLKKDKNLKVIIAPRHPERSVYISNLYKKNNLQNNLESYNKITKNILIVNSFGNLEKYFLESDIVFLGGSLIDKGGHNPIEPAINNCAIITGPYIFNWDNVYNQMIKNKACIKLDNPDDIEKKILNLYDNYKLIKDMKTKAKKIAKQNFFNNNKLFDLIKKQIGNK